MRNEAVIALETAAGAPPGWLSADRGRSDLTVSRWSGRSIHDLAAGVVRYAAGKEQ